LIAVRLWGYRSRFISFSKAMDLLSLPNWPDHQLLSEVFVYWFQRVGH